MPSRSTCRPRRSTRGGRPVRARTPRRGARPSRRGAAAGHQEARQRPGQGASVDGDQGSSSASRASSEQAREPQHVRLEVRRRRAGLLGATVSAASPRVQALLEAAPQRRAAPRQTVDGRRGAAGAHRAGRTERSRGARREPETIGGPSGRAVHGGRPSARPVDDGDPERGRTGQREPLRGISRLVLGDLTGLDDPQDAAGAPGQDRGRRLLEHRRSRRSRSHRCQRRPRPAAREAARRGAHRRRWRRGG